MLMCVCDCVRMHACVCACVCVRVLQQASEATARQKHEFLAALVACIPTAEVPAATLLVRAFVRVHGGAQHGAACVECNEIARGFVHQCVLPLLATTDSSPPFQSHLAELAVRLCPRDQQRVQQQQPPAVALAALQWHLADGDAVGPGSMFAMFGSDNDEVEEAAAEAEEAEAEGSTAHMSLVAAVELAVAVHQRVQRDAAYAARAECAGYADECFDVALQLALAHDRNARAEGQTHSMRPPLP